MLPQSLPSHAKVYTTSSRDTLAVRPCRPICRTILHRQKCLRYGRENETPARNLKLRFGSDCGCWIRRREGFSKRIKILPYALDGGGVDRPAERRIRILLGVDFHHHIAAPRRERVGGVLVP